MGRPLCALKGQKDADSILSKIEAKMDYSFLTLQFLLLQCIKGVPYITLQRGNGELNPSVLKAFGRPRFKLFGFI